MRRLTLLIPLALGLVGCERPVEPVQPIALARTAHLEDHGVVQSASGGAHRLTGGEPFILSFQANKRADGSVTGSYHVDVMALGATVDVNVTCMSVVGNIAWVGGIIEKSDSPLVRVGTVSYFYAIDNGEGTGDAADQISALRLNDLAGEDQVFCTLRPLLLSRRAIDFGNIQVRE
jgi:hypothetical protein